MCYYVSTIDLPVNGLRLSGHERRGKKPLEERPQNKEVGNAPTRLGGTAAGTAPPREERFRQTDRRSLQRRHARVFAWVPRDARDDRQPTTEVRDEQESAVMRHVRNQELCNKMSRSFCDELMSLSASITGNGHDDLAFDAGARPLFSSDC